MPLPARLPASSPARRRSGALRLALAGMLAAAAIVLGQAQESRPSIGADASAQTSADWPQFQHDVKRNGYNPQSLSGPFSKKWSRDLGAALAHRVQPVIAGGVVVVGDVSGRVYGLNESSGGVRWTYQTGGPISYSAAIDAGRVFVGSQDGSLYALDLATGAKVWQARTGGKPIGGSPLVYDGRLYVGGKDGVFYTLNAATGSLSWTFDTAGVGGGAARAPILTSPAISPARGLVYFAAENLRAYALNAANGALAWSYQMTGESAYDSWPVVSEANNVVMFRTKSVYSFHSSLGLDDADLFCPGQQDTGCGSCAALDPEAFNAPAACNTVSPQACPAQWNEQHGAANSIDWILNTWPQRRTFFALNLDTGAHVPAPILWTGGGGRVGIPPVVNDASGDVYLFARTKWSRRDAGYFCRKWVDIVRLTFTPSQGTFHFLPCAGGASCPDSWGFHFIGDETTVLSLSGNLLVGTGWFHTGSLRVDSGVYADISGSTGVPEGANGSGGDSAAPASIADKTVFVKQRPAGADAGRPYTLIVAYQGQ